VVVQIPYLIAFDKIDKWWSFMHIVVICAADDDPNRVGLAIKVLMKVDRIEMRECRQDRLKIVIIFCFFVGPPFVDGVYHLVVAVVHAENRWKNSQYL